ncbi:putative multidrug resistance protein [Diplogelasinospora grovesii]|uniref:Multidrug resistance protein n=1 Tax=Diplogelasinospora grovesii TaxID=303347 RepID=A0AAN6N5A8_9PEZI|nr:putative multidrug resistance protein [Diplogelasinospora grovesii]
MFSCLDTSIVSTALVSITVDLDDSLNAPWTVLAYLLTYMSFAVGFSKMSDIYGRKNLLVIAWLFFAGFSIWCALASTMTQLIIARALQGIGGSGLYSLAQVCLVEQGPNKPAVVGALVGVTLSISYVLGPLLGGGISALNWRGIFWINVPFGVLAVAGIYMLWPDQRRHRYDVWTAISKIDFLGNLLLIMASILFILAIQQGGSWIWDWTSPALVCTLFVSALCWVLLGVWEWYLCYGKNTRQIQPIFPLRLATGRVYLSVLIVTLLTGFVYIALVIEIPERLQIIHGDSALQAGVHLLPMLGCCAFGSFLAGAVSKTKNLSSPTLLVGTVLQVLGISLMYSLANDQADIRPLLGFTAIYGLGVGLCFCASTIIASIEARNDDLAAAQGALAQARVFGGAVGLAACTIIFNAYVQRNLVSGGSGPAALSDSDLDQIHRSPLAVLSLASPEARQEVIGVYMVAFSGQMYAMIAAAALAVLASLCTYRPNAPPLSDVLAHHKDLPTSAHSSAGDTELESVSGSVRSLIR